MEEKNSRKGISRRGFLKNVGTGVAASYTLPPLLKSTAKSLPDDIKAQLEGKTEINIRVNGKKYKKMIRPSTTLAEFIRDELKLTGTKIVCNHGECGGCTVVLDGKAVYSCHMLALDADGKDVITIEGLEKNGELNKLQSSFIEEDGLQCGFCTPGQIMSAYALLLNNPNPSKEELLDAMSGNLCRCGAYPKIVDSVLGSTGK